MSMATNRLQDYIPEPVIDFLMVLRGSLLISITVLGLLFIASGMFVVEGVVAGMLGTWGASLILVGVVGYALLWFTRYY